MVRMLQLELCGRVAGHRFCGGIRIARVPLKGVKRGWCNACSRLQWLAFGRVFQCLLINGERAWRPLACCLPRHRLQVAQARGQRGELLRRYAHGLVDGGRSGLRRRLQVERDAAAHESGGTNHILCARTRPGEKNAPLAFLTENFDKTGVMKTDK